MEYIYVVIPVYNRVKYTLNCLDLLSKQTHPRIKPVVVDGGSTDDTPAHVRAAHPSTTVLTSDDTLYWGGAMRLGVDWALMRADAGDYLLMMNNDVSIGVDLAAHLLETSRRFDGACVGGVVVDAHDPERVIDGGGVIDWPSYSYHTKFCFPEIGDYKTDCDVLPGRATLIPIAAILESGSVDARRFPHYLADYEFTHRIKKRTGRLLIVDYRVKIATWMDEGEKLNNDIEQRALSKIFGRKSKSNIIDHLNFLIVHAPSKYKIKLILRVVKSTLFNFFKKK